MFEINRLIRKNPVRFKVIPMVRRYSSPVVERAVFIKAMLESGASYQNAIREYDRTHKKKK